ncbi:hypothetical protein ACLB2K_065123 [Fragaria x ananassa]
MSLIHLFLDGNNFTGLIPETLGLVQTLEMVQLDKNFLTGTVPSNLNNLTNLNELNLANNNLTGPLPDLTVMNSLNYVSSALVLNLTQTRQSGYGIRITSRMCAREAIQPSRITASETEKQLELVDLQNNQISLLVLGYEYKKELQL